METDYINSRAGIQIESDEIIKLLGKMSLSATSLEGNRISVSAPATRSDILHACDVVEDVAIAYGYNNISKTAPKASTVGSSFPINKLSDQVRREIAMAGYTEVLPLVLV